MSFIREKVNYLKGMADGMELGQETKEGKMILGILELLDEMTFVLDEIDSEMGEMEEFVEFLDEDLSALEDEVYDEMDMDDFDDDYEDFFDEDDLYCPSCGAFLLLDDDDVEIECPECGQYIEIFAEDEWGEEEEEAQKVEE